MTSLPIKKRPNFFIHDGGYVTKIERGREIECRRTVTPKSKRIITWLDGSQKDLLFLILEYFFPTYNPDHKVTYSQTPDLKIPIANIKIRPYSGSRMDLLESDLKLLNEYKCNVKAAGANARHKKKITGYDVFSVLKAEDFLCVYCNCKLHPYNWHLDHFHSIAQNGENVIQNLAPSCGKCNIMKSTLDGYAFVNRCLYVVLNNRLGSKNAISISDRKKLIELYIGEDVVL
jgi:5-methylcytosine-specific restriction endonuclease McrA